MKHPNMKRDNYIASLHLLGFKKYAGKHPSSSPRGLWRHMPDGRKLQVLVSNKDTTVIVYYNDARPAYSAYGLQYPSTHRKKFKHDFRAAVRWLIDYCNTEKANG